MPSTHRLKCWFANFDALLTGGKCCEIRSEQDRKFAKGDFLHLVRTDRDGSITQPETSVLVEITHVERFAGTLALIGQATGDGPLDERSVPIAVLSLSRFGKKVSPAAAEPAK